MRELVLLGNGFHKGCLTKGELYLRRISSTFKWSSGGQSAQLPQANEIIFCTCTLIDSGLGVRTSRFCGDEVEATDECGTYSSVHHQHNIEWQRNSFCLTR